jgi:hypothetical protein
MVNSFLCSSTKYFENILLPNDLIIIRNRGDDEKDEWDTKRALERQGYVHIKVVIQSNSEFQCFTLSQTRSPGPPRLQIDVQDAYDIGFGRSTFAWKWDKTEFLMELVRCPSRIRLNENC